MRVVRVEERAKNKQTFRLHHLTDLHVGAPDFAEKEFKARVKLIEEDPDARWTFGGDGGDLIRFNDRRFQPTELHPRYRQATDIRLATLEHLQELLQLITDKCWGCCDGNHERAMDQHYGGVFGPELWTNLGIPEKWVGARGFIKVNFVLSKTVIINLLIDLQHGWQAGRTRNFKLSVIKEMGLTEAQIMLRGHSHQPAVHLQPKMSVTPKGDYIRKRVFGAVDGGCWRYGYRDLDSVRKDTNLSEVESDMWSEAKGFAIENVGGPVLLIRTVRGHGVDKENPTGNSASLEIGEVSGLVDEETLGL